MGGFQLVVLIDPLADSFPMKKGKRLRTICKPFGGVLSSFAETLLERFSYFAEESFISSELINVPLNENITERSQNLSKCRE